MMRFVGAVCLLASCVAASAPLSAQISTGGSVRGYVKDEQEAVLPGVRLTATSPDAPGTYTATSDENGYYRLLDLPPGEYSLSAEREGFAKWVREGLIVRAGLNITVGIVLRVGTVAETVEIRADSPLIESSDSFTGVNISGDLQRSVPLTSRRDWADFLGLVPGVVSQESTRAPIYFLHGSSFDSHVFLLDGADVSAVSQSANSYINLGTEVLGDVQVKTAAVDASSPLGVGVIASLRTRSGTDQFRVFGSIAYQSLTWNDSNSPGGTSAALRVLTPEVAAGGPIVRGRWWFFGGYRYFDTGTGVSRTAAQMATVRSLDSQFSSPLSTETANLWFGKSTTELSPRLRFESLFQYDVNSLRTPTPTSNTVFSEIRSGGRAATARLSLMRSSNTMMQMSAAYNDKGAPGRLLRTDVPSRPVHQRTSLSGGRLVGTGAIATLDNAPFASVAEPSKVTLGLDLTRDGITWLGSHQLRAGISLQTLRQDLTRQYTNGGFALEELVLRDPGDGSRGTLAFHRQFFDIPEVLNSADRSVDHALYVQDAWRPVGRATVNAGIRVDVIRRTDRVFDAPVQRSTEIGPRMGLNYAVIPDGRGTARASWGRIHNALSVNRVSAGSVLAGFRDLYDLNLDGDFETTFVNPASTNRSSNILLDPDRHQPYVDEATVGYEQQFPGLVTADVSVIRRTYRERTTLVETNAIYDGSVFRGYANEALNEVYRLTNNTWNWPVYTGLDVRITKQASRVQMIGGYSRQWRHLDGTWQPGDPAALIQPDAFTNNRGIGDSNGAAGDPAEVSNSLSGRAQTQGARTVSQWQDHVARLGVSYSGPGGLLLAASYVWQTGPWSGPILRHEAAPDPRFGPPTVRLSNGRVVSNPLATTLRFAYDTRGNGQITLPSLHNLSLRIGKRLNIFGRRIELGADVSNLTNHDADQSFLEDSHQQFSPNFGIGRRRQLPRAGQVWAKVAF